mgnify:CR=1 FL=1
MGDNQVCQCTSMSARSVACDSSADITKLLNALPPEQWVRLSFDLNCFAEGGLNIKNVDTPMLITTKGEMSLSIADISLVNDHTMRNPQLSNDIHYQY